MTQIELFAGIGGFGLAGEWAGIETVCQVEIDPFCQRVLAKNFPNAQRHDDIKTFDGTAWRGRVDIVSGGFPCQPYSYAGKRLGNDDNRALWPQMLRVIQEVEPAWIVGENVAGLISMDGGRVFAGIVADLENAGYSVEVFVIPACAVGAPHRRDRVWIVAHRNGEYSALSEQPQGGWVESPDVDASGQNCPATNPCRIRRNGRPPAESGNVQHNRANGQGESAGEFAGKAFVVADADSLRKCEPQHEAAAFAYGRAARESYCLGNWGEHWLPAATRLCRVDNGLPRRLDRSKRLKALGNAIVPQVAFQIFQAITTYPAPNPPPTATCQP